MHLRILQEERFKKEISYRSYLKKCCFIMVIVYFKAMLNVILQKDTNVTNEIFRAWSFLFIYVENSLNSLILNVFFNM